MRKTVLVILLLSLSAWAQKPSARVVTPVAASPASAPVPPVSVALSWTASVTPGVTYNVYRSTTSGTGYSEINTSPVTTTAFSDTAVSAGTTYYYVVTSFNGTLESSFSNQATAVVPSAPAPPTGVTATVVP